MRKLVRTDAGLDYVRLLSDHAARHGISKYSKEAIEAFGDVVQRSLLETADAEHRLRGLRMESLFMAVVAGIGKVSMIKHEDAGEGFFAGDDLLVPDFRIVLVDGRSVLVEVKSFSLEGKPRHRFKLPNAYVQKLMRYGRLCGSEVYVAVFWEHFGQWTLNRLSAFAPGLSGQRQPSVLLNALARRVRAGAADAR